MEHQSAQNGNNESSLDIVFALIRDYPTRQEFYGAAIRMLWDGYESHDKTEDFIGSVSETPRSLEWLTRELQEILEITPTPGFEMPKSIASAATMVDEWNAKDIVWSTKDRHYLFSWGTSA